MKGGVKHVKRSRRVSLGAGYLLFAASLTGCAAEPDTQRVCVEDVTEIRVEDTPCPDPERRFDGHSWYYINGNGAAPGVGHKASGGSFTKPAGAKVASVPRGGFGGKSSSGGG